MSRLIQQGLDSKQVLIHSTPLMELSMDMMALKLNQAARQKTLQSTKILHRLLILLLMQALIAQLMLILTQLHLPLSFFRRFSHVSLQ